MMLNIFYWNKNCSKKSKCVDKFVQNKEADKLRVKCQKHSFVTISRRIAYIYFEQMCLSFIKNLYTNFYIITFPLTR